MNGPTAIPQTVPATTRIVNWLRDKVSRARSGGERPYMIAHIHERPRITVTTDQGIFNATLFGACLYDDAIVIRFGFRAPVAARVGAFDIRFGRHETKIIPPVTLDAPAGALFKFMLACQFTEMGIGDDADSAEPEAVE